MALTKVSGEVITRPLVLTGNASVSGIMTVGTGSTSTTIDGSYEYPTIRPTLDLNFAATKTLDRRITFTRDSLGTYTDELGIVKYAPNNTPRFDHDPVTGESLGLLIEESRTNDARNSSDFSSTRSASVYGDKSTVNTNVTTAPDGTLTADQIVTITTGTQNRLAQSHSVTSGTYYTYSIFVKYDNLDTVQFYLGYGGYLNASATFTFSTETVSGGGGTAAFVKYPNGWYRISFATQAFGSGTAYSGFISGTTADLRVYVWGEQIEAGSFPTSYIPTSGSTVTRAADLAKITGTNFTDFYNQTEGTFFIDSGIARGSSYVGYLGTGTSSAEDSGPSYNFNAIISDNDNSDVLLDIFNGNVGAQAFISILNSTTQRHRIAGAYASNDFAISLNGSSPSTDPSGTADPNQDQFWIGRRPYTSAGWLNNSIKRVSYYNKRLPNAQLQGLTAQ